MARGSTLAGLEARSPKASWQVSFNSSVYEPEFVNENKVVESLVGEQVGQWAVVFTSLMEGIPLGIQLSGKHVGIVGLGRIGLAVAKRAEAFGCSIAYHSRSKNPNVSFTYQSTVIDLAARSDILVLACPLTKETFHIIDRSVLDALGKKGILINIGRGPLVDENELVKALVEGRLGGAGLDVYKDEPNVPEELFSMDNVVLLPHVGTKTWETRTAMADLIFANFEAYFSNKPLLSPVEL